MNKDELIMLKSKLENEKNKYCALFKITDEDCYEKGTVVTKAAIYKNLDTKKAVEAITKNFESAIYHYCNLFQNFDKLIINPYIYPFVKTDDIIEEKDIDVVKTKENPRLFPDIVALDLYRLFAIENGDIISEIGDSEYIENYDYKNWFTVSLKELKRLLLEEGLKLEGINSPKDLLENNYKGQIVLDFNEEIKIIPNKRILVPPKKN